MKKTTTGLFAATMVATCVAALPSVAEAAPYPGSKATVCDAHATGKPRVGNDVMVETSVQKANDNVVGSPKGKVKVTVEKLNGGDSASGTGTKPGDMVINLGHLKRGTYTGSMEFTPGDPDSKFAGCSAGFTFTVRPRS